jgi:Ca2+-binding RTX toxin-like protein
VLTLFLATAAPSMAARAEVAWTGDKYGSWAILYVTAEAGERNDIVVTQTGGALRVTDSGPVTDGGSCDVQPDGSAVCHGSGLVLADLWIDAGDLDDSVRAEFWQTHLSGGAGDDVLTVGPDGSSSAEFNGGPGDDRMIGGAGPDHFIEDFAENGSDVMLGGTDPGSVDYVDPGDEVSYADRVNPIRADLQGDHDDGERGEGDQIGSDVESIAGGAGADILTGSAVANRLDGGDGADLLTSGAGNDLLLGGRDADRSADRLLAGPGSDYIYGGGGNDSLYGGPGNDEVRAGPGRDRVRPGKGRDNNFGGPGNDTYCGRWTGGARTSNAAAAGTRSSLTPSRTASSPAASGFFGTRRGAARA